MGGVLIMISNKNRNIFFILISRLTFIVFGLSVLAIIDKLDGKINHFLLCALNLGGMRDVRIGVIPDNTPKR